MENVYYSAIKGFIPATWKDDGTYSDETWPADAVLLTDEENQEYWKKTPPFGKTLSSLKGRPVWVDLPPLTHEQLVERAESEKRRLKIAADSEIDWRQDAVDGVYAEADEVTELAVWKKYRVLLMRIDTSKAPDITWPIAPE